MVCMGFEPGPQYGRRRRNHVATPKPLPNLMTIESVNSGANFIKSLAYFYYATHFFIEFYFNFLHNVFHW